MMLHDTLLSFRVIVGAPEAQTTQPNVFRGGAVYRCDIAVDDSCIPVEFDRKGNIFFILPVPSALLDEKILNLIN